MSIVHVNTDFGAQSEFLVLFIAIISVVWAVLFVFSYRHHGLLKTLRLFVPMMVAALFIEASGVASGRFYYPGYILYFSVVGGSVPLIILLGWSSNLYIFLHMGKSMVSNLYQKNNFIQLMLISITASGFGICLDLLEDPLAHHNGWWIWAESASEFSYYSVPVSNFIDWFIILFFMSLATLFIDQSRLSEKRKLLISFSSLPVVFAAILVTHFVFVDMLVLAI